MMFDDCKEIPNSPPKSVLNEALKTHHKSARSLQIYLPATLKELHDLKNEDIFKVARNETTYLLITTVKVSLQTFDGFE